MPSVTVRGLPELKRDMARLSAAVQTRLGRNATMAMARVVTKHARLRAPIETGALRASIKARRDPDRQHRPGQVVAFANAKLFYARFIEFGTKHIAARPFLRPALDEHHTEIKQKLLENLSRGIARELRKLPVPEDPGEA